MKTSSLAIICGLAFFTLSYTAAEAALAKATLPSNEPLRTGTSASTPALSSDAGGVSSHDIAGALSPDASGSSSPDAAEREAMLVRFDRALNPESYTSYKKIINIDRDGSRKEFVMFIGKKGRDKVLGTFLAPRSEVGRSTLRVGENMWLYIPNVKKPVRITSLQSVTGGLFNNSDIMGLDYSDEYTCEKALITGATLELSLKARSRSVAYDRVVITAMADTYQPLRIDCLTAGGMLIKTLEFKEMTDFGEGLRRPAVTETTSPLQKGARSIMIYSKMAPKALGDELFTLNSMSKYGDLRH